MKVCAAIISFGKVPYLPRVLDSLTGIDTFIIRPNKSWWSDAMTDCTIELAGVTPVVSADLANETDARNYAKKYCEELGYDVMLMPDTDEIIDNIPGLLDWIESTNADAYCIEIVDYYPDENTPLPKRGHCPIVAIRLGRDARFYDKRCYSGEWIVNNKLVLHHYSLLLADEHKYKLDSPLYDDSYPPVEYRDIVKLDIT